MLLGNMILWHAGLFAACASLASGLLEKPKVDGVPQYVLDYAPLCYLHHQEVYLPSDLQVHLNNTTPQDNDFKKIEGAPSPLSLTNLNKLNDFADGGKKVYLTSKDDITNDPAWLKGAAPDCDGKASDAIAVAIIIVDKGDDNIDAFYQYFYSFNWGGVVLKAFEAGHHVGDWEQNMIRFEKGKPTYVWFSQHGNGQAFAYDVLEKSGQRFVNYIANGSHANYAVSGSHDHTISELNLGKGILMDYTDGPKDGGKLWDPLQNAYFYKFSDATGKPTLTSTEPDKYPTEWLDFLGRWGDKQYPKSDKRQQEILGGVTAKYVNGPTGPIEKQLVRKDPCPDYVNPCILRHILSP
ncbi:uncharacterized protein IWZ02DRAFT_462910 [Phyllosticta citriasiana]|uniref:Vacuolar protein sorting-associated protein 62 n=1 Tax=Phyllosticta citriasiana TaxID=595635 RepID=A0ABR1KJ75_9PEZI